MKQTLLEKAKSYGRQSRPASREEEDLALAWIRGEVATSQAMAALNIKGQTGTGHALARALRSAYTSGRIKVVTE